MALQIMMPIFAIIIDKTHLRTMEQYQVIIQNRLVVEFTKILNPRSICKRLPQKSSTIPTNSILGSIQQMKIGSLHNFLNIIFAKQRSESCEHPELCK